MRILIAIALLAGASSPAIAEDFSMERAIQICKHASDWDRAAIRAKTEMTEAERAKDFRDYRSRMDWQGQKIGYSIREQELVASVCHAYTAGAVDAMETMIRARKREETASR